MLKQTEALLREELRPAPERHQMMFRYVLVAGIVLVISMTLQIPSVALSIIMMFSATRENARMTMLAGKMIIIGATCAVLLSLLLLSATLDWTAGRVIGAMILVFAGMFFLRASRFGSVGYLVAVLSVVMQSEADTIASPDALVRSCLWLWVAVVYPVVTAIVVARLMPAASASRQLRSALSHNWRILNMALLTLAQGKKLTESELSFIPGVRVSRYQQFAVMDDPSLSNNRAFLEQLRDTQHLVEAAVRAFAEDMQDSQPSPVVRVALEQAAAICERFSAAEPANWPENNRISDQTEQAGLPDTMILILTSLDGLFTHRPEPITDTPVPQGPQTLMRSDWYTNQVYMRFALKAALATFICYLFYNAVDWPGIRTCMTTAIILALPSLGSSVHKAHLRITGCLVGALLSILCIVFVLPYLESITGLLVVSLPVVALAGWLAAGSTRINYAGNQAVYAWALAMYGTWGMTLDLTTTRDRIVGILIGAGVVVAVFSTLWPERSELTLSSTLRRLLSLIREATLLHQNNADFHRRAGQLIRRERHLSEGLANEIYQFTLEHPENRHLPRDRYIPFHSHAVLKQLILIQNLCQRGLISEDIRKATIRLLEAVAEDMAAAITSLDSRLYIAVPETYRVRLIQLADTGETDAMNTSERNLLALCHALPMLLGHYSDKSQ
ncbi:TPA: FUSC family protein [Klebsiella aerogenes]|nr:FUSC family protein [Klebsiella aerogenes]